MITVKHSVLDYMGACDGGLKRLRSAFPLRCFFDRKIGVAEIIERDKNTTSDLHWLTYRILTAARYKIWHHNDWSKMQQLHDIMLDVLKQNEKRWSRGQRVLFLEKEATYTKVRDMYCTIMSGDWAVPPMSVEEYRNVMVRSILTRINEEIDLDVRKP